MSGPTEQELRELTAAYALGALEGEEARAFEAYLARSPEAQREVAEFREVNALLALRASDTVAAGPAPDLRERTLARATQSKVRALPVSRARAALLPWIGLAASLVAVAGLGYQQLQLRAELQRRDSTIVALQGSVDAGAARLAAREAELNSLLDPNVTLTRMGTPGTPQPVVQLFWNRRTNLMLAHAFQLPPAASRRAYQLWFIPKHGNPIPSVTFNTEPGGHGVVQQIPVPEGMELTAAALTDEPEGGSPQPTTTPFLIGTLGPTPS